MKNAILASGNVKRRQVNVRVKSPISLRCTESEYGNERDGTVVARCQLLIVVMTLPSSRRIKISSIVI